MAIYITIGALIALGGIAWGQLAFKWYGQARKQSHRHEAAARWLAKWLSEATDKERQHFQIKRYGGYGLTEDYWYATAYRAVDEKEATNER